MRTQSFESKFGEIEFRKKMFQQQVKGKKILKNELGQKEITELLAQRVKISRKKFLELRGNGLALMPFLEIGAERCQRSLLLCSEFNADGFAVDISFESLLSANFFSRKLGLKKMPSRVCCDAYNLPFKANSFPFVFCYDTLHHFPDPEPIVKEAVRVMSTGFFLLGSEPVKRFARIGLFTEKKAKGRLWTILNFFFSKPSCNETSFGIVENRNISLLKWLEIFKEFKPNNVIVSTEIAKILGFNTDPFSRKDWFKNTLSLVFGGSIQGLFFLEKKQKQQKTKDFFGLLSCPTCIEQEKKTKGNINNYPALSKHNSFLQCKKCKTKYPIKKDVIMLFSKNSKLYDVKK